LKQIIFLILIFFFSGWIVTAAGQQARFDDANSLLEESSYREAIDVYKSIADDGYHSGALWLNMGIAYSYLDSLGVAKYYLMKAEKYSETRELAAGALDYVDNRFSRRSAVLPPLPWDRFLESLSEKIGTKGLIFIALFFLYLGVALMIGSWFRYDLHKFLRYSGYSVLGISAIFFMFSLIFNYQDNRFGTGVMVERQGQVFQQPEEESSVVSTAFEGYTMRVDFKRSEDFPDWKYVRLENGMYGWIKEDGLMVL
jgi:hypothetical protein